MKNTIIFVLLIALLLAAGAYYSLRHKEMAQPQGSSMTTSSRVTTPSGLAYEVLVSPASDAAQPQKGQVVSVHYTGWLNDNGACGTKFDSSVDRGQPFQFPLGMGYVIQGWDEAVAAMKVGEKRRVYIPSKLGYGSRGAGAVIKPNSDLIFDIEVLEA